MTIPVNYIHGAREQAMLGRREARATYDHQARPNVLSIGRIAAVQANNTYQVEVLDDAGNVIHTWDYLRVVPHSPVPVGAIVWLVRQEGYPMPVIMVTGGGGATELGMVTE